MYKEIKTTLEFETQHWQTSKQNSGQFVVNNAIIEVWEETA